MILDQEKQKPEPYNHHLQKSQEPKTPFLWRRLFSDAFSQSQKQGMSPSPASIPDFVDSLLILLSLTHEFMGTWPDLTQG